MTIIHIDTGDSFRGGQQALLSLARGLHARGHKQTILSPAGSELAQRAEAEGISVAALSASGLRGHAKGADILHAHTGRGQTLAWAASAGIGVKRVVTRHVAFAPRHPKVHRFKYMNTCDGVIAVSQAVRRVLLASGVPAARIETITTGVEIRDWPDEDSRQQARSAWGLKPSDFAVGHVGAFTHEKGQDVAAEAARLLEARLPELRMILAGAGPLRSSLPASSRVILPGDVADPSSLFSALDLFIMPSRSEGWGLAALEAMAFGLPVIASNTGGLAEIVEDRKTGWLIPPADAPALASAIADAFSQRERLREIGRCARRRAEQFSIEETAKRTEEFYLHILSGR